MLYACRYQCMEDRIVAMEHCIVLDDGLFPHSINCTGDVHIGPFHVDIKGNSRLHSILGISRY